MNKEIKIINSELVNEALENIEDKIKDLHTQHTNLTSELQIIIMDLYKLYTQFNNATNSDEKNELLEQIAKKNVEKIDKDKEIDENSKQMKELENRKKEKENEFKPYFQQEIEKLRRRDIQMDGFYSSERNCFIETIESPKNADTETEYYVDFKIKFTPRPLNDNSQDDIYDFADVMNIGLNPFQNNPEKFNNKWLRKIEFENVWDRHSFKIYSSIAEESSKGYLGNSQIFYQPIKYFKLNSTDQRFWIEFYSGRFHKIPVKIPLNESFVIEIQLLPFNKLLYI